MLHNIVLQAYERSIQAQEHCLLYSVPLREDPKKIEQIRKIQEKLQQLENSCAKVTNGYKKISTNIAATVTKSTTFHSSMGHPGW